MNKNLAEKNDPKRLLQESQIFRIIIFQDSLSRIRTGFEKNNYKQLDAKK